MIDTSTKSALVEKEIVIQKDYICDIIRKIFLKILLIDGNSQISLFKKNYELMEENNE